ncbi:MAG: phospholipase [Gammaproteobacteria bacterium]|nr:phospholipase [Gammaproteobacteria bacterium]MCW5584057.1 phospholipase [Gammaproteobacteria bacterium]
MSLSHRTTLLIFLWISLLQINTAVAANSPSFASAEHVAIGNSINLYFSNNSPGQAGVPLLLPNGLHLTYGDIVSSGDFYELPNQPISQANSETERRARFLAAFSSLAIDPNVISEATQIMDIIRSEEKTLSDGLKRGEKPEDIYNKIGHEYDRQFNCITGGGCSSTAWWLEPGRYLTLATTDYDHFGDNAWITYKTGHQIALEQAIHAHETKDLKKLELAYAMNAFACHFLTDRFASGHMRTPRVELPREVTPNVIGSLLSNYMHNEENVSSLHVHNLRGDRWIAYGDRSYFNPQANDHRKILLEAVQDSADQIFSAFQQGSLPMHDNVYALIPQPDENASTMSLDIAPLFYWNDETKKLMRRSDMSNPYDNHWTSDWWGWSTLVELERERGGLSNESQALLAQSTLAENAIQDGLIINKDIIAFIKKK